MRYFTSFLLILVVIAGSLVAFVPEVRNWSLQQTGLMTQTEHQQIVDDLTNQIDDLEGQIDEKQTSINSLNNFGYSIYSAVSAVTDNTTFATINEYLSAGGIELTVSSVIGLVDAYDELAGDTTLIDTVADVNEVLQGAIQIEYEPAENETATEILINSTVAGVSQLSTSYSTLQSELALAQQRILDLEAQLQNSSSITLDSVTNIQFFLDGNLWTLTFNEVENATHYFVTKNIYYQDENPEYSCWESDFKNGTIILRDGYVGYSKNSIFPIWEGYMDYRPYMKFDIFAFNENTHACSATTTIYIDTGTKAIIENPFI